MGVFLKQDIILQLCFLQIWPNGGYSMGLVCTNHSEDGGLFVGGYSEVRAHSRIYGM